MCIETSFHNTVEELGRMEVDEGIVLLFGVRFNLRVVGESDVVKKLHEISMICIVGGTCNNNQQTTKICGRTPDYAKRKYLTEDA